MKKNRIIKIVFATLLLTGILLTQSCKKDDNTNLNTTCDFTPLADNTFSYGSINGPFATYIAFVSGANWQLAARDAGSPSTGIGIQFPVKPTAAKTYNVVDYGSGQVSGDDNVFVYVSQVPGGNDNGVAGGCLKVTMNGNGKVVATFKDLSLASGKKLSATIIEQ